MFINSFNRFLDLFIKSYLMCFTALVRYYIINLVLSVVYLILNIVLIPMWIGEVMKNLYTYLSTKDMTVKDFEDKACIILENNDGFIPFAKSEIMQHYKLASEFENEVAMVLAQILTKQYTFAK